MELLRQRGAHPVELDGRTRIVFFDLAATWLLVEKFGPQFPRELYTINADGQPELRSLKALAFFLFVGLQAGLDGEELTLAEAESFIRPWTLQPISNAVLRALTGATHTPADPEAEKKSSSAEKHPAAGSTGKRSKRRSASHAAS